MASSTPFDGTVFLTSVPDDSEPHGNDYQEHQSTRKSMEFANNKEHTALANPMSTSVGGGVHKNGSSVAYFASTAPTLRPDGLTALAANDVDKGRVWFDSTFTPPVMMKWDGSAWAQAGNKVLNGTFYTSVNEADDGTVDLIKAGRNVANDADVAILTDKSRLATDASPIEDTDITNKKYVDTGAYTPTTAYAGEESVTLPNGTILKSGVSALDPLSLRTITFAVPFPGGIVSYSFTGKSSNPVTNSVYARSSSASAIQVKSEESYNLGFSWQAIGY